MNSRKRIETFEELDGIDALIMPPRNKIVLVFLPIWIFAWTLGGVGGILQIMRPDSSVDYAFTALWLSMWLVGEVCAICAWLWNAFGKELVSLRKGHLVIKRAIGGYGPTKIVPTNQITDVRILGYFNSVFHLGFPISTLRLTGGRIAVEWHKGTETFGFKLKENEASALVEKLKFHFNRNI